MTGHDLTGPDASGPDTPPRRTVGRRTAGRRTLGGLAALATAAALLVTGCGPSTGTPGQAAKQSAGAGDTTGDSQLKEMQQKVDSADSAAAQAESDATQNN